MPKGQIFIFSGPSGVGKGTLISALKKKHPDWIFAVSCTTRKKRSREKKGENYYYLSLAEFKQKIDNNEFLEWAFVHEKNYYGTLKSETIDHSKKGKIVIRELNVEGFLSTKKLLSDDDFFAIFISPVGGIPELIRRILKRGKISDSDLAKRVKSMKREFKVQHQYDQTIYSVTGKIDKLVSEAEKIIQERINDLQ